MLITGGKFWNGGEGLRGGCEDARSYDGQACIFQVIPSPPHILTDKPKKNNNNKKHRAMMDKLASSRLPHKLQLQRNTQSLFHKRFIPEEHRMERKRERRRR